MMSFMNAKQNFCVIRNRIILSIIILCIVTRTWGQDSRFTVNTSKVVGENTSFWKATGTDLLYYLAEKPAGQTLLDRMEVTKSCVYLRNHYTLMPFVREGLEVGIDVYSEDTNGNPVYDFSRVNRIYREFVKRGLKPIVEYDYLPEELVGSTFSSGNDEGMSVRNSIPVDWDKWSNLLVAFTQNLVDTFGIDEVKTWYFEVWNEPDGWNRKEIQDFYKLYDVFAASVKSVHPDLKVGGPACYHEWFLQGFLEHVCNGMNHVTGEKGSPIDFVSYHIYGLSGSWLNKAPVIKPQVQRFTKSVLWIQRMFKKHPQLGNVEFHINEWGLSSHYQKTADKYSDLEYRNSEESALFLVKLVDCLYAIKDQYGFSTDQLLYWGGAWEAHKNKFFMGHRTLTTAGNTPKPIQTAFEMLAQLKENRIEVKGPLPGERVGILATQDKNSELALLVYNYNETDDNLKVLDNIEIDLLGMIGTEIHVQEITMDSSRNNTYREWQRQGAPNDTSRADMKRMMDIAKLNLTKQYQVRIKDGIGKLKLNLPRHSMTLINIEQR